MTMLVEAMLAAGSVSARAYLYEVGIYIYISYRVPIEKYDEIKQKTASSGTKEVASPRSIRDKGNASDAAAKLKTGTHAKRSTQPSQQEGLPIATGVRRQERVIGGPKAETRLHKTNGQPPRKHRRG